MNNAYNVSNVYLNRHKETGKALLQNVIVYLERVGLVGDPEALELLEETVDHLKAQKQIDNKDNGAKAPSNLKDTLKNIQQSLARIEHKEIIPSAPKNYTATAVTTQIGWNATLSGKDPKLKRNNSSTRDKASLPKKTRRAREITVHITDRTDKEKIKTLPTKNLVKALQADTNSIRGVSRLISGNIKIHTKLLEAKKALQKQTR